MYKRIELKPTSPILLKLALALPWLAVIGVAADFPGWPPIARALTALMLALCALWDGHRLALRDGITSLCLTEKGLSVEQHGDGHWQSVSIAHASRIFSSFVILRLRVLETARYRPALLVLSCWPGLANITPDQMRELRTWLHLNPPPHTTNQPQ